MKFVFLYTELAQYFIACIHELGRTAGAEIHIVRWPVNREAPFDFTFPDNVKVYNRNEFNRRSLTKLVSDISPDVIYCSGWMDKDYLSVCARHKDSIPVLVGIDNHWRGDLRQRLASFFCRQAIRKYFTHCWIPGPPQRTMAEKMGFTADRIVTGFYTCDYDFFHDLYLQCREAKRRQFPRRFIFAGRYAESKGIKNLWKAFIDLQAQNPCEWELWCIGTGDISPAIHPKIRHFGFVQPDRMKKHISETGVFILPSTFEPWGVVLHEFAAAGFPALVSSEVGAATLFLKEGVNGFKFEAANTSALLSSMKKIIQLPDEKLFEMGEQSALLATRITPRLWVDALCSVALRKKHSIG